MANARSNSTKSNVITKFSSIQAQNIAGITYRQLDHWARTKFVEPSIAGATGSGSRRIFSYSDLLKLKIIKSLLDSGVSLQNTRRVFTEMEERFGETLPNGRMVVSGKEVLLVSDSGEEIMGLLARPGQLAMSLIFIEVEGIRSELDNAIVRCLPVADKGAAPQETASDAGSDTASDETATETEAQATAN